MNLDLFENNAHLAHEIICDGAIVLRGFALQFEAELLNDIPMLLAAAPLRTLYTPGELAMSATNTSCGSAGWVSDAYGYRYTKRAAQTQQAWPPMPASFLSLAQAAAQEAGYNNYAPDSCLINCYIVGAKMSLHQDKNEKDFTQPIVSVSLGLPATFLLGGLSRADKTHRIPLIHGDVMVWGGSARLYFHGVLPIKKGRHSLLGEQRINLTFRKAL